MDDDALSGDILPPDAPSPSPQSVALARRISKGVPSAELQALLVHLPKHMLGALAVWAAHQRLASVDPMRLNIHDGLERHRVCGCQS